MNPKRARDRGANCAPRANDPSPPRDPRIVAVTTRGWGGANGKKRAAGAAARELLRLGPLVWASADDMVLEAWDVDAAACVSLSPHRDLGPCVAVVPHAAAGQVVTVHATGAVQLWWAMDEGPRPRTRRCPRTPGDRAGVGGWGRERSVWRDRVPPRRRRRGRGCRRLVAVRRPSLGRAQGVGASGVGLRRRERRRRVVPRGGGGRRAARPGEDQGASKWHGAPSRRGRRKTRRRRHHGFLRVDDLLAAGRSSRLRWQQRSPRAREKRRGRGVIERNDATRAGAAAPLPLGGDADARFSDATDGSRGVGDSLPTPGSLKNTGGLSSQASSLGQNTALIPFKEIRLKKCIGEGSFGRVYVAVWANHTEVAVKMLGPPSSFRGEGRSPGETARAKDGGRRDRGQGGERGERGRRERRRRRRARGRARTTIAATDGGAKRLRKRLPPPKSWTSWRRRWASWRDCAIPTSCCCSGLCARRPPSWRSTARAGRSSPCSSDTPNPAFRRSEWRVRLQMALGAAAGMCYLHNCAPPIIHRDLKSPNLMVDRYFRVKGGRLQPEPRRGGVRGLQSSEVGPEFSQGGLHSPRWMAPEVLRRRRTARVRRVLVRGGAVGASIAAPCPGRRVGRWQVMHAVVEEGRRPDLDESPRQPSRGSPVRRAHRGRLGAGPERTPRVRDDHHPAARLRRPDLGGALGAPRRRALGRVLRGGERRRRAGGVSADPAGGHPETAGAAKRRLATAGSSPLSPAGDGVSTEV